MVLFLTGFVPTAPDLRRTVPTTWNKYQSIHCAEQSPTRLYGPHLYQVLSRIAPNRLEVPQSRRSASLVHAHGRAIDELVCLPNLCRLAQHRRITRLVGRRHHPPPAPHLLPQWRPAVLSATWAGSDSRCMPPCALTEQSWETVPVSITSRTRSEVSTGPFGIWHITARSCPSWIRR